VVAVVPVVPPQLQSSSADEFTERGTDRFGETSLFVGLDAEVEVGRLFGLQLPPPPSSDDRLCCDSHRLSLAFRLGRMASEMFDEIPAMIAEAESLRRPSARNLWVDEVDIFLLLLRALWFSGSLMLFSGGFFPADLVDLPSLLFSRGSVDIFLLLSRGSFELVVGRGADLPLVVRVGEGLSTVCDRLNLDDIFFR
jgi:hypothetical protein